MAIYKDPSSVTYDSTATTGCKSISAAGGGTPRTAHSDDGTLTHFVVGGGIAGTIVYEDPAEAAKIANKVAAGKNLSFHVTDETDTEKTVTITNIKTGSVRVSYVNGAPSGATVPFVADGISPPAGGA